MKKLLFLSLLVIIMFSSCKKDNGSFELTFTTKTQSGNLVLFENFDLADGTQLNLNKLQFYISDLRLLSDGGEVQLTDVNLVSFNTHSDASTAALGETLTFNDIPQGEYSGIKFGIGVNTDLNAKSPTYYAGLEEETVLSSPADYWSNWESYVFTKIEGYFDRNGNGTAGGGDDDEELTYHTGTDELYREKTINSTITVPEGGTFNLPLTVDIDKIFNSATAIDIPNESIAHSNPNVPAKMVITNKVADNLVEAIGK